MFIDFFFTILMYLRIFYLFPLYFIFESDIVISKPIGVEREVINIWHFPFEMKVTLLFIRLLACAHSQLTPPATREEYSLKALRWNNNLSYFFFSPSIISKSRFGSFFFLWMKLTFIHKWLFILALRFENWIVIVANSKNIKLIWHSKSDVKSIF